MKLELGYTFQFDFIWGTHNAQHMLHRYYYVNTFEMQGVLIAGWMDARTFNRALILMDTLDENLVGGFFFF